MPAASSLRPLSVNSDFCSVTECSLACTDFIGQAVPAASSLRAFCVNLDFCSVTTSDGKLPFVFRQGPEPMRCERLICPGLLPDNPQRQDLDFYFFTIHYSLFTKQMWCAAGRHELKRKTVANRQRFFAFFTRRSLWRRPSAFPGWAGCRGSGSHTDRTPHNPMPSSPGRCTGSWPSRPDHSAADIPGTGIHWRC